VFPFHGHVESGVEYVSPEEDLDLNGEKLEDFVNCFYEKHIVELGYHLEHFTKVPYISAGDTTKEYYVLSNFIFVLSVR